MLTKIQSSKSRPNIKVSKEVTLIISQKKFDRKEIESKNTVILQNTVFKSLHINVKELFEAYSSRR